MSAAHLNPLTLALLTLGLFACGADELEVQNKPQNNLSRLTAPTTSAATSQTSSATATSSASSLVETNTMRQTNVQQSATTVQMTTAPKRPSGNWWQGGATEEDFKNKCAPSDKIYDPVTAQKTPASDSALTTPEGVLFDTPCPDKDYNTFYTPPVVVPRPGKSAVFAGYVVQEEPALLSYAPPPAVRSLYLLDPEEGLPSCFEVRERLLQYNFGPLRSVARQGKMWLMLKLNHDDGLLDGKPTFPPHVGAVSVVGLDVLTGSIFLERSYADRTSGGVTPRVVTSNGQLIVESLGHIISLSSETGETYWSLKNDIETTQIREYGQDGSILIQGGGKTAVIDRCGKQTKVASIDSDDDADEPLFKQAPTYSDGVLFDGKAHRLAGNSNVFSISEVLWGAVTPDPEKKGEALLVAITDTKVANRHFVALRKKLRAFKSTKEASGASSLQFSSVVALDANRIALVGDTNTAQYLIVYNIKEKTHSVGHLEIDPRPNPLPHDAYNSPTFTPEGTLAAIHNGQLVMWSIKPGAIATPFPLGLERGTPMNMPLPVP